MEMLWERARHNAELVALGGEPAPRAVRTARAGRLRQARRARRCSAAAQSRPRPRARAAPRARAPTAAAAAGVRRRRRPLRRPARWRGRSREHPGIAGGPRRLPGWASSEGAAGRLRCRDGVGDESRRRQQLRPRGVRGGAVAGDLVGGGPARWVDGSWQHTFAIELLADGCSPRRASSTSCATSTRGRADGRPAARRGRRDGRDAGAGASAREARARARRSSSGPRPTAPASTRSATLGDARCCASTSTSSSTTRAVRAPCLSSSASRSRRVPAPAARLRARERIRGRAPDDDDAGRRAPAREARALCRDG